MPSASWLNGWLTGDLVSAGEFRKGVGCVADSTLGVAAASIDFTGLPTSYAHLMVVLNGRGDTAAATVGVGMRFNNDSTAGHYNWETLTAVDATVSSAGGGGAATSYDLGLLPAASSPAAGSFGAVMAWILHYGSGLEHPFVGINACAPGSTGISVKLLGGQSVNLGAVINRITFVPSAGNFAAGTRASIYAMGA